MVDEKVANALGSELLVELDVICPAPAAIEAAPPTAVVTPPKIVAALEPSAITPATVPSPGTADSKDETPPIIDTMFCQLVLTTVWGGGGCSLLPRMVDAAPVRAKPALVLPPAMTVFILFEPVTRNWSVFVR